MKIELTDSNGCIQPDGIPTLVILLIDGMRRIPYPADRTIQQLYYDVQKLNKDATGPHGQGSVGEVAPQQLPPPLQDLNTIQREDIVKCVKMRPRDPGSNQDLKVGDEYRVVEIISKNKIVEGYELIDDNSDFRMRITVTPDEIELVRKAPPKKPREMNFQITKNCECGEINVLELNGNQYECNCVKCGKHLIENRPSKEVSNVN